MNVEVRNSVDFNVSKRPSATIPSFDILRFAF